MSGEQLPEPLVPDWEGFLLRIELELSNRLVPRMERLRVHLALRRVADTESK